KLPRAFGTNALKRVILQRYVRFSMNSSPPNSPGFFERLRVAVPVAVAYGLMLYILIWVNTAREWMPFIGGLMLLPMAISSLASSLSDPRAEKGLWRHV